VREIFTAGRIVAHGSIPVFGSGPQRRPRLWARAAGIFGRSDGGARHSPFGSIEPGGAGDLYFLDAGAARQEMETSRCGAG